MKNFMKWLVPNEEKFFDMLTEEANNLKETASQFKKFIHEYNSLSPHRRLKKAEMIKDFEHKGDKLARKIINELDRSFLTPFDSEDIHQLAVLLDDVIDIMNLTAHKFITYKIKKVDRYMVQLADILYRCVVEISEGVNDLRKLKQVNEHCVRVSGLENDADNVKADALAALFENEKNPIELIKRKEIIESIENATDKCEHIAHVFDGVIVKHG
ncbi:MAG TPA: DUF47 family protein [Candidatus Nanoarchaeia archaeon]|nr:DUF47 family protein [Candidatus Nanoarchaeia archaeon]